MTHVLSGFSWTWPTFIRTLAVLLVLSGVCSAQQKPDFSGTWVLDPSLSDERGVYGQMRIVRQGPSSVEMTVLHFASGRVSVIPWHLPFDKWSPRRGGESSREPIAQSRWDGDRLITLKAPGTSYSVLWMWSLSPDGNAWLVDAISTGIGFSFDFKASSAPKGYIPDHFVYARLSGSEACGANCSFALSDRAVTLNPEGAPFVLRFGKSSNTLSTTCLITACTVVDVVNGQRGTPRTLTTGGSATFSVDANTVVERGP